MKNKQLTKSLLAIIMLLVLNGCNKEKNTITEYIGTVIEGTTMAPLPDVKVSVANGSRVLVSTVTDEEGAFSMYVNFDKVTERDSLIIDGNPGLPYVKKFELKGMGKEQYDYRTLVLYNKSNTEVKTSEVTSIKSNSAVCGGTIIEGNDILVTQRGVCWSKQPNPILFNNNNITLDGEGGGQFTSNLTGLEEQTKYYVRAYATNGEQVVYGGQKEFTTTALLPTFQYAGTTYYVHPDVGTMTWQSAIDYCDNLTFAGYSDWFLPDKDELNTMYVNRNSIGGFVTTYSHNEDECKYWSSTKTGSYPWYQRFNDGYQHDAAASNYYRVRPVRKDGGGGGGGGGTTPTAPTVTTNASPTVTSNSATCGGNVTSTGGADITERGVYYGTSPNPVSSGQMKPCSTTGSGTFTCNLTGLSANTKYYFCAYARNSVGPSYGTVEEFTTLNNPTAPTVTTGSYSNVGCTSATCGGSVTAENGVSIDRRGVCYGTSPNPTTSNQVFNSGTGTGSFTCNLTGLTANTKYYYRAYAIYNGNETKYGEQKDFTTLLYATFDYAGTTYYVHPEVGTMTWQSAMDYCDNLYYAGYSDWYLPNKDELNAMYVYRNAIGDFVTTGTTESNYWSSTKTEYDDEAWYQRFSSGSQNYASITLYKRVRPVRRIGGGGGGSAPSAPTGVTAEVIGSKIKVSWNGVSNADSYTVFWSNDGNTYNFEIGTTSNTYIFDDAPTEDNYYKVKAKNSYGESPLSSSYGYCHYSSGGHVEGWLQYDDGYGTDALGFEEGGTLYWANMFPSSMLGSYQGTSITKVEAYLNMAGVYTLRLYSGGTTSPGSLIYQQNFNHNNSSAVWATMTLSNAVSLNTSQNLWVVISVTHSAGEYPAGCCQNAGNPNGRWYSDGIEWGDIGDVGDFTWGIHTFVTNGVKGSKPMLLPSNNNLGHENKGTALPSLSSKNSKI